MSFINVHKNENGFTIVELLIVIVVIAILAAITIVSFNGITRNATESSMKADLRNAASLLGIEHTETGQYPSDTSSLNGGKGLVASGSNIFMYSGGGDTYCVSSSNPKLSVSFVINSASGQIEEGTCAPAVPDEQVAKLLADDGASGDKFGLSVSISGDVAIVGAPNDNTGYDSDTGSAYIYVRSGATWNQQAKLTANSPSAGGWFGSSVFISGDTAVVGSPGDDARQGAVYIFTRSGNNWSQQAKLVTSDGGPDDGFGTSVSLAGDTLVAGASFQNNLQGSAYVFTRSGNNWSQQAKLVASDGDAYNYLGDSVSIDGDTVVLGATGANSNAGAAYIFARSGSIWSQQAKLVSDSPFLSFGSSVSISGNTLAVGESGNSLVHIFTKSGSSWSRQAKLSPSDEQLGGSYFGIAVALLGDRLVATSGSAYGAGYIFTRSNGTWSESAKLTLDTPIANDRFGYSISLSAEDILIGAYDTPPAESGAAYIFTP